MNLATLSTALDILHRAFHDTASKSKSPKRHVGTTANLSHCLALLAVADDPEISVQDMGRAIGISSPGITCILDRMERAGLAVRAILPHDRRRYRIDLTEAGRQLIDALRAV